MTTQSITIRLALTDGGKVKAELADIGASGQKALERIRDASVPGLTQEQIDQLTQLSAVDANVIHALESFGKVVEHRLDERWAQRCIGSWRFPGVVAGP